MFISETTSFTQETYLCAFPSLTSFTPNVNVLSDVFICELGLVARQHLTEEMNNITDCTMLRDATTHKGHHFDTSI
jgi:hypothetical protein